jgi:hypothetical protein
MYKKITHNIVEEHFAHPAAMHMKAMANCPPPEPPMAYNYNMESVYNFRSMVRPLLAKYFWRIRSSLVSILDGAADQTALADQTRNDIDALGQIINTYYGHTAAAEFVKFLNTFTVSVFDSISAIKAGKDTVATRAKTEIAIAELAKFLNTANTKYWPSVAIVKMLTDLETAWLDQATARKKSDWVADFAASDTAQKIAITDPTSFSDVFVNGIVHQFPDRFIGS